MKKKATLGITALAVLASTIPTHIAPVAAQEELLEVVYTSFDNGGSNSAKTGDGTANNPFNLFEDAIKKVAPGGTIIIVGEAFLNEVTTDNLPFYIDKKVTITSTTGTHASLEVRTPGIILGADVKFENISLEFINKHHDSIFANGHRLDLINVTRPSNTRLIDLFAGGLGVLSEGSPKYEQGPRAVINVVVDSTLDGNSLNSEFGNIYAGSMNGEFNGTAEINVSRKDATKKLTVEGIKSSGALEANSGHMLDTREPLAPETMPDHFPMKGNVQVNLHDYQVSVDGLTGSEAKTNVSTTTVYNTSLPLRNVDTLHINSGTIKLTNFTGESLNYITNVQLAEGTALDLTGVNRNFNIDNYTGNGTVILRTDANLHIANDVPQGSSVTLAVQEIFNSQSGTALEDHVYINTPESTEVKFIPHATQEYLVLHPIENDSRIEWKIVDSKNTLETSEPLEPQLPTILEFEIDSENANRVIPSEELNGEYGYPYLEFPFKVKTDVENWDLEVYLDEYDFEYYVNEHKAEYREEQEDYYVANLGLSLCLIANYYLLDHKLVVMGKDADGNLSTIAEDTYEIKLSHKDKVLTTSLTVTGTDKEQPEEEDDNGRLPPEGDAVGNSNEQKGGEQLPSDKEEGDTTQSEGKEDNGESPPSVEEEGENNEESGFVKPPIPVNLKPSLNNNSGSPSGSTSSSSSTSPGSNGGGSTHSTTSSDSSSGSGVATQTPSSGGVTTPLVEDSKPSKTEKDEKPNTPSVEKGKEETTTPIVNGVENIQDLDKELQEKVDSIIVAALISENGLSLTIKGEKDDVSQVSTLEITKDGIFAAVEGKKLKFDMLLDLTDIDWKNSRVIRLDKSGTGYSAVPHKLTGDGFKIFSRDFENILITSKVREPFEDVTDKDWFKQDVEEMYNYGFTTGTTATTFSPSEDITQGQFAVFLARALELTPNSQANVLSYLEGKWYQNEAQALYEAGIIKGFNDSTFSGEEKLTREQAATMLVHMLKYAGVNTKVTEDVPFADMDKISKQAKDAVQYLASSGVLTNGEDVNFNPHNNLTRAQMAKMLVRSLHLTDLY